MPVASRPDPDPDALVADLAEQYFLRLRAFAARRLRDASAAEDAAQETLRRVMDALRQGRVRDLQALPAYIYETARHVCQHMTRDSGRHAAALSMAAHELRAAGPVTDPLADLISQERRVQVDATLAQLPPDDLELIELSYGRGLAADEVGQQLGISAANVRVRRHRILRRIAAALDVTCGASKAPEKK